MNKMAQGIVNTAGNTLIKARAYADDVAADAESAAKAENYYPEYHADEIDTSTNFYIDCANVDNAGTALFKEYVEKLLKHYPYVYCPTLGTLFTKNANPTVGDIVIFYSSSSGTFTHSSRYGMSFDKLNRVSLIVVRNELHRASPPISSIIFSILLASSNTYTLKPSCRSCRCRVI